MSTVLVTGGSGFIGSRLIQRLQHVTDVQALVRPGGSRRPLPQGVRSITVDLMNAAAVAEAVRTCQPTVVFHCAMWSGHPSTAADRIEALATSVNGTCHLAEAAAAAGVRRFVHLGSFLGYRPQPRPIRESDPLEPLTSRGAAKAAASLWLRQFATAMQFPAVELRVFSVYGPGELPHRFIPVLLRAAHDGTAVSLLRGASRDLVFVDDVVDACLRATEVELPPGAVFNVGGGQSRTTEEIVDTVREVSGRPIRIADEPYTGSAAGGVWLADISEARATLGWTPTRSLHAGLTETLRCLS